MTHQTPTRAQAEAWLKRGSIPLHWGIIASADDVLEKLKSCRCGQCDNIRADMLSYDNHIPDPGNMAGVVQTAIKHDSDKTRYSLLPWEVMGPLLAKSKEQDEFSIEAHCMEIDNQLVHDTANWFSVALNSFALLEEIDRMKLIYGVYNWPALRAVAEVFTSGAIPFPDGYGVFNEEKGYYESNWRDGLSETRRLDACRRHWAAYCCGEEMSEHGHHHLAHVLWYGLVGMWYDAQEEE